MANGKLFAKRKTCGNKEVLQLVDRDAVVTCSYTVEGEHLRGSQAKEVFELLNTVQERYLNSSDQRRVDL